MFPIPDLFINYHDFGFFHCLSDVNECLQSDVCEAHAVCSNTIGSYTCKCDPGYSKNTQHICTGRLSNTIPKCTQSII